MVVWVSCDFVEGMLYRNVNSDRDEKKVNFFNGLLNVIIGFFNDIF